MSVTHAPVCVIVTTHNSPRSLEFTLTGLARQDCRDFEILIADDGSGRDTRDIIARARALCPVPITHVWQPHPPWYGKPSIQNKAILTAKSPYLIFIDGDIIPRHDFVRAHIELRRPRTYLAGGDFRLSPEATAAITLDDVTSGRAFTRDFLRSIGQPRTRKFVKLLPRSFITRFLDAANISPARWSGSNASGWREDLVRVDGFDEAAKQFGREDTELGIRLRNDGVKTRHVRHNAICLHMYHGLGSMSAEAKKISPLLEDSRRTRRTRAREGISQTARDFTVDTGHSSSIDTEAKPPRLTPTR